MLSIAAGVGTLASKYALAFAFAMPIGRIAALVSGFDLVAVRTRSRSCRRLASTFSLAQIWHSYRPMFFVSSSFFLGGRYSKISNLTPSDRVAWKAAGLPTET